MSRGWIDGLDGGSGVGGLTSEVEMATGVPSPQSQVVVRSSLPGSVTRTPKATLVPACAMTVGTPLTETVPLVLMTAVGLVLVTVTAIDLHGVVSSSDAQTVTVKV